MIKAFTTSITLLLIGCSHPVLVSTDDGFITKILKGDWLYSIESSVCPESGWISFKTNGEYSRSSEDCQLADDSFGNYYYGWYVANRHICFVNTKEHLLHAKSFGFVEDHCRWKIVDYSNDQILVHQYWHIQEDETPKIVRFERETNP